MPRARAQVLEIIEQLASIRQNIESLNQTLAEKVRQLSDMIYAVLRRANSEIGTVKSRAGLAQIASQC